MNRDGEVPGREVARVAAGLIRAGLLRCCYTSGAPRSHHEVPEPLAEEFAVYDGYDCASFEEHMKRFGYGPHEFETTEAGIREIERPMYEAYATALGW